MNKTKLVLFCNAALLASSVAVQAQLPAGSTTTWSVQGASTGEAEIANPNNYISPAIAIGSAALQEFEVIPHYDHKRVGSNAFVWQTGANSIGWWVEAHNGSVTGSTQNASFRLKIQGPASCAGLTRQISISASYYLYAYAHVRKEAPSNKGMNASLTLALDVDGSNSQVSVSGSGPGNYDWREVPLSSRLIQKSVTFDQNGAGYVDVPFSMNTNGNASRASDTFTYSEAQGTAGIDVSVDNRTLTMTRVGAPAPKQKGAAGVTIDEAKDEWVEADGTGHGHTTYAYQRSNASGSGTHLVANTQTFSATFTSSNTPQWQWSPSSDGDTATSHSQDMPKGNLTNTTSIYGNQWSGTPTGTSNKIITYDVTDTDGTTAKGRYELTLHDPWEIVSQTKRRLNTNHRPHPYSEWTTAGADGDTLTGQVSREYSWAVGITFTPVLSKTIAKLVGVDVSVERTASVGVTVGDERNNVQKGWACRVIVYDVVDLHSGTVNQWDWQGYVGDGPQPFEISEPTSPNSGGMELGPLEWHGDGPQPPGNGIYTPPVPTP